MTECVVSTVGDLQPGDQICYPTQSIGKHHAIVVKVAHGNQVTIIDFTISDGLSVSASQTTADGTIQERTVDLGEYIRSGKLWRYVYRPGTCFDPAIVIERAHKCIGRVLYDLINFNCEHFARFCKTGEAKSQQIRDYAKRGGLVLGIGLLGSAFAVGSGSGNSKK